MIKVVAKNCINTKNEEEFIKLCKELIAETVKETGCISYALHKDIKNEGVFTFIEEWEDQDALNAHMNSKHFTTIAPLLGEFSTKDMEVNMYTLV